LLAIDTTYIKKIYKRFQPEQPHPDFLGGGPKLPLPRDFALESSFTPIKAATSAPTPANTIANMLLSFFAIYQINPG
jgi:hypothetical protein